MQSIASPRKPKAYLFTIKAYGITYKAFGFELQKIIAYLQPKIVKAVVIVRLPLHAHFIAFFEEYPRERVQKLRRKGFIVFVRYLPNAAALQNAERYIMQQEETHASPVEKISGGELNMGKKASEILKQILEKLEDMDERIKALENGKQYQSYDRASNGYEEAKLPVSIKRGRKGVLLFLNSYRYARNKPYVILSDKQLAQLKAEIDKLLRSGGSKKSAIERREGFNSAIEED